MIKLGIILIAEKVDTTKPTWSNMNHKATTQKKQPKRPNPRLKHRILRFKPSKGHFISGLNGL